jgi:phosphoribosylanthranilate isomerase
LRFTLCAHDCRSKVELPEVFGAQVGEIALQLFNGHVVRALRRRRFRTVPTPAPAWVLLDAPTPGFGGQGVLADWTWAARVVSALAPLPVWLAGGLRPDNARAAIDAVRPAGLDVASGAEVPGDSRRKERAAVHALLAVCRGEK